MRTAHLIALGVVVGLVAMAVARAQDEDAQHAAARPTAQSDARTQDEAAGRRGQEEREKDTQDATTPAGDEAFYKQALAGGISEVELSQHAVKHAQSEDVRAIASRMVDHHGALNSRLKEASGMSSAPPLPPADAAKAEAVRQTAGATYDRAWLDHMAEGHAKSIALYEHTSTNATSAKTRRLASEALPTLREHARSIKTAQSHSDMKH